MATNTILTGESAKPDSPLILGLKKFWKEFWDYPSPTKMYPEEAAQVLRYQARRERALMPHPLEGEASPARSCFFLRKFSGKRELYAIDTEAGTIIPLAFLAFWKGEPEHYDLEIGTPKP